jgi:hypothetical protein
MTRTPRPEETLAHLMGDKENAARAKLPYGIEAQRMDGQRTILEEDVLPRDLRPGKHVFQEAGFKFGKARDGLLVEARLPEGWRKTATEHASHVDLSDGEGRRRGFIFYNAAFHDRNAFAALLTRYQVKSRDVPGKPHLCELGVWDTASQAFIHTAGQAEAARADRLEALRAEAAAWLDANLPTNENPLAYW